VRASLNGEMIEMDVDESGDEALRLSDKGGIIGRHWVGLGIDMRNVPGHVRNQDQQ
jgi:hypothetical protein